MRLQKSHTTAGNVDSILTMLTMLTMLTYLVDNIEYCRQVEEEGEMKLQESETSADDASNNVVNVD